MVSYYFQSKENLYISVFDFIRQEYFKQFDIDYTNLSDRDAFLGLIDTSVSFSVENEKLMLLMLSEQIYSVHPAAAYIVRQVSKHHFELFLRLYKNSEYALFAEKSEGVYWKYFTFFYNLKNYVIFDSNIDNPFKIDLITRNIRFLEKTIEEIFQFNHRIVLR